MSRGDKSKKYGFRELASRITGISIPIFGVSWEPVEAEREIIRKVLLTLEDSSVLYNDFRFQIEYEAEEAIHEISKTLTDTIKHLPEKSMATQHVKALRSACHEYDREKPRRVRNVPEFYMPHLGRLRTIFGYHIAQLSVMYGIDIDKELAVILPPEYKEEIDNDE